MKKDRIGWLIIIVAPIVAATGCTTRADLEQVNSNQFVLRGMIASDRQRIDSLEQRIRRLNGRIAQLGQAGQAGAEAGVGRMASLSKRLADLEAQVGALEAGVAVTPAAAPPPPEGTGEATTNSTAEVPPGGPPLTPVARAPAWRADLGEEIKTAAETSEAGAKLYREGLQAMSEGKYPLAVVKFAKLQHNYRKSPLSEPAEYFAANALFEIGKFDQSILQFNDLVMRFPKGRFACAALLRQAEAFLKLNDRIDARLTLQKLIADDPNCPGAEVANSMIKDLVSD